MKNLLLGLALLFAGQLFSQTDAPVSPHKKFSLGVLGGVNINFMPFNPNLNGIEGNNTIIKPEYGYFAGLTAHQPFAKKFAAKMDVQYAVRGYDRDQSFEIRRFQASYLDFVPQVEYSICKHLKISLGGYAGFWLQERIKVRDQNWTDPEIVQFAEKQDFGLASGLRLEFDRVSFLIKYQHGLTPGIKWELVDDTNTSFTSGQYHRSLQIGMGFKLI